VNKYSGFNSEAPGLVLNIGAGELESVRKHKKDCIDISRFYDIFKVFLLIEGQVSCETPGFPGFCFYLLRCFQGTGGRDGRWKPDWEPDFYGCVDRFMAGNAVMDLTENGVPDVNEWQM